jgi:hypothetical protein
MRGRLNSKSQRGVVTRYAALKVLVEISNRVGVIDWNVGREGVSVRERDYATGLAAVRMLARAQILADTPASLRVEKATLEAGNVFVYRPAPLRPFRFRVASLFADIQDMRDVVFRLAKEHLSASSLPVTIRRYGRLLGINSDFTIDSGPELFTDTLLRALAGRDVRRLRRCPQPRCDRLFVAIPSDKIACSPECASAQRVHRFLASKPGYYTAKERKRRLKFRKRKIEHSSKRTPREPINELNVNGS